jgi:riboflavin synthase
MFTGIVAELGTIVAITGTKAARIAVRGELVADCATGDSVSVNGICLTVADRDGEEFSADVMPETLRRTTAGSLRPGDAVNLELAATPVTRLGGHIVQGHVDGVATVVSREPGDAWDLVVFRLPAGLARYAVEKGSIALDGVSLTVVTVVDDRVTVSLIPETLRRTTLGRRQPGDQVNVEVDVLAKHVERLLEGMVTR